MRRAGVSIRQTVTLKESVEVFVRHCIDTLPVTDHENRVVGLLTIDDLVDIFMPRYFEMVRDYASVEDDGQLERLFGETYVAMAGSEERLILAADAMTLKVQTLQEEDSLLRAAAVFQAAHAPRLPVVNRDGQLVGLISETAILLALLSGQPVVA